MIVGLFENIYYWGDEVLRFYFGSGDFGDEKYMAVTAVMFLLYEPAIVGTSLLGCLMLLFRCRWLNSTMLALNALMMAVGIAILTAINFPHLFGPMLKGDEAWIPVLNEWIGDAYRWADTDLTNSVAETLDWTTTKAKVLIFVFVVPGLPVIMNTVMLLVNMHRRNLCWKLNLILFSICFVMGCWLVVWYGVMRQEMLWWDFRHGW